MQTESKCLCTRERGLPLSRLRMQAKGHSPVWDVAGKGGQEHWRGFWLSGQEENSRDRVSPEPWDQVLLSLCNLEA